MKTNTILAQENLLLSLKNKELNEQNKRIQKEVSKAKELTLSYAKEVQKAELIKQDAAKKVKESNCKVIEIAEKQNQIRTFFVKAYNSDLDIVVQEGGNDSGLMLLTRNKVHKFTKSNSIFAGTVQYSLYI